MSVGTAGPVKSTITEVEPPSVPLTAVCCVPMLPAASVWVNSKASDVPPVSVPSRVLVKVLEIPLKANFATSPLIVPFTVEPASVSKVTVTMSPSFALAGSALSDAIEMLVGTWQELQSQQLLTNYYLMFL